MCSYKLVDVLKRKNKEGREYFLAYVLVRDDYGYSLINCLVQEKQVEPLLSTLKNPSFDLNKFIGVNYNSFTKAFQVSITYAL